MRPFTDKNCIIRIKQVCTVAAKMSAPFVLSLRRDVRGGEESAQLSRISELLDTVVLSNMGDRRFWDLNGDGCFCVKDVRRMLDDMLLPKSDVPSRWVKQIPIKVNVLAWKISMDRLPTRVNLHRRGVQVSPISCPICCEAIENLDHLLFCCDLAKDIARSICNWWGLVWNPVDSYRSWLSWFNLVQLQSSSKQVLEGVFYTSWWSIWSYRNHLLFSDSNPRKDGIFEDILRRFFSWYIARGRNMNTIDFLNDNYENDAQSSDNISAAQDEQVTTLEDNINSECDLDKNPSVSTQSTQNLKRSSKQSVFLRNYNDLVVDSKVKYGLENFVGYSKLYLENYSFVTQLNKNYERKTFFEASKFSHWTDAMNSEMNALLRNKTWDIVDLPKDRKTLGSKWIFKIKYKSSGKIDRYKARFVAQLFGQKEGIDYEETFSPVVKMFMHSPLKLHLKIDFKILRYLKSCPGLGIHIIKNSVWKCLEVAAKLKGDSCQLLIPICYVKAYISYNGDNDNNHGDDGFEDVERDATEKAPHDVDTSVDIEKVAVCSSLRSLKAKCTIESRAKRSSKIISLGYYSIMLASSHTVKSKTDIKSPTHYPGANELTDAFGKPFEVHNNALEFEFNKVIRLVFLQSFYLEINGQEDEIICDSTITTSLVGVILSHNGDGGDNHCDDDLRDDEGAVTEKAPHDVNTSGARESNHVVTVVSPTQKNSGSCF
nr:RNA-directed DNA polymerase, eukaryota [Tanacetum cinerariifolium]